MTVKSVTPEDIRWFRSESMTDGPNNGGAISVTEIIDGQPNNVWPDVTVEESNSGSVKYRKTFIKVENDDGLEMINAMVFVESQIQGDVSVVIFLGTQMDTQADLETEGKGPERFYGAGKAVATWFDRQVMMSVEVESGCGQDGHEIFREGDLIRISDKMHVEDTYGMTFFLRAKRVVWNGLRAEITTDSDEEYVACALGRAKVASVIEIGRIGKGLPGAEPVAVWEKRTVPPGSWLHIGSSVVVAVTGESE